MKLAFFLSVAWADERCWSPDSPYTGTISRQIGGLPCQSQGFTFQFINGRDQSAGKG